MSGWISTRTAERALVALDVAMRLHHRNGGDELGPEFAEALRELHAAAAVSPTRQKSTAGPLPHEAEAVSARQAAQRLGCSIRTIERRAAVGELPADRIGGRWAIWWTDDLIEQRKSA